MSKFERARKLIIGNEGDWIKPFNPEDFLGNVRLIEKLHEEKQLALLTSIDLENQAKGLGTQIQDLKLENERLRLEVNHKEEQLKKLSFLNLENQIKKLETQLHNLELEKQELRFKLDEVSRKSSLMFFLSLLAVILVGVGVNVATSSFYNWTGWVMVLAACIIEIIVFFSRPQK